MKKLTAAIAATLFATGVSAGDNFDFHHGWDSPDLSPPPPPPPPPPQRISGTVTGVQRGIGDSFDFHQGWAGGNPDLSPPPATSISDSGDDPDIYQLFRGNPDLQY